MKRGKASGPDNIPAEAIKADIETSSEILRDLFGKIWEQEEIPTEWKEGYLVKLPKEGDLQECKNYRGDNAPISTRKGPQQSNLGQT